MRSRLRVIKTLGWLAPISAIIFLTFFYSYEFGHWWKLVNTPANLYKPAILEHDVSLTKGDVLNYELEYDYYDFYDLGILLPPSVLPSSMNKEAEPYVFSGRLKIKLRTTSGRIIREKVVHGPLVYKFGQDLDYYSAIVLDRLPLPSSGLRKPYNLEIIVLEEDKALSEISSKLYLSVSSGV
jgi:hypothetical protein